MIHEQISAPVQKVAADVVIAPTSRIVGERIEIDPGVVIEDNVDIQARVVRIGYRSRVERRTRIAAIGGAGEVLTIGDFSVVGHDTTILVPHFAIGDYTEVHNHVLVNGYQPCTIGHNSFIGQHSVLNATESLTIGNNFRMALNGYIWTHAMSGELLEGCTIYYQRPVVIEDDVWMAGCNSTISPGLRIARGTIILLGTNVTHDTEAWHCYGGSPARDLTDKLRPYRTLTLQQKVEMMKSFAREFVAAHPGCEGTVSFVEKIGDPVADTGACIVVAERGAPRPYGEGISVYSIAEKTYLKTRSQVEEDFMRFLVGARARFVPIGPET
jgi:acetyltransferase-like isoleucine patch superfamily enzyme